MEWQPQKGDRVMFSDKRWSTLSNDSKRAGRRGGVVTSVRHEEYGTSVGVRWDGRKTSSWWGPTELCPDDPTKHSPPPKVLRERAKSARRNKGWLPIECAPMDGRLALVYRPLARESGDEPVAIKRLTGGDGHCWPCTVPEGATPTNPTDGSCHVTHWMPLPAPPDTKD
jgi:hypothetical protein